MNWGKCFNKHDFFLATHIVSVFRYVSHTWCMLPLGNVMCLRDDIRFEEF